MKTWLFTSTTAAVLLLAGAAAAQGVDEFGAYGYDDETVGSPQNSALELRFGPYRPRIDEEFANDSPYQRYFGSDDRYVLGFEYDWQALEFDGFGTLGPGLGFGYTKMTGMVPDPDTQEAVDQETTLSILPMYVVAVLRVDVLAKRTPVPLVPYAKAGIGYAMWWTDDGVGLERSDGITGEDTSWGSQFALGLMLLLDSFDRRAAANIDSTSGVNNSYVFLEWYNSNLDGFGSGDHMNVGSNSWMTGIALEL